MFVNRRSFVGPLAGLTFLLATASLHCGSDDNDDASTTDGGDSTPEDGSTSTTDDGGGTSTVDGGTTTPPAECASAAAGVEQAVCAANAFLATLSDTQKAEANLAYTDKVSRTKWSNLPGQDRPGPQMGDLSETQQAAALAMMATVLTANGISELNGIRAADDYLAAYQGGGGGGGGPGGGGPGGGYGSSLYHVAIFGTPSTTDKWEIMFGGHHMAFNINYVGGVGYPIPNHAGVEPKGAFTQDNASYAPLDSKASALVAIFDALDATTFTTAHLSGTFGDVVIGPQEYGTGSYANAQAKFPTGSNRTGVLVSSLSAEQRALVTKAIELWVRDYAPETADALLADYTSDAAYADTYVAWGGTASSKIDVDVNGTYMRIDGPRAWIELACQAGAVIQNVTHYHTIYRDKSYDYGDQLQ